MPLPHKQKRIECFRLYFSAFLLFAIYLCLSLSAPSPPDKEGSVHSVRDDLQNTEELGQTTKAGHPEPCAVSRPSCWTIVCKWKYGGLLNTNIYQEGGKYWCNWELRFSTLHSLAKAFAKKYCISAYNSRYTTQHKVKRLLLLNFIPS